MFRLVLALWLGLTSTAIAQESEYFYTRQECYPLRAFMDMVVIDWGESALFTGRGVTLGQDGTPFTGGVMLLVNQETGTWTLGTMYDNGTVCINAAGTEFEPYTR